MIMMTIDACHFGTEMLYAEYTRLSYSHSTVCASIKHSSRTVELTRYSVHNVFGPSNRTKTLCTK